MGFVAPEETFMRKNAAAVRKHLLTAADSTGGMINGKIAANFDQMIDGKIAYDNAFFRVLCFQIWCDVFNVEF